MRQILARRESSVDGGFGFADAIVGIVVLALAVLMAGSILASAAAGIARTERDLRTDLEARRELVDR